MRVQLYVHNFHGILAFATHNDSIHSCYSKYFLNFFLNDSRHLSIFYRPIIFQEIIESTESNCFFSSIKIISLKFARFIIENIYFFKLLKSILCCSSPGLGSTTLLTLFNTFFQRWNYFASIYYIIIIINK